MQKQDEWDKAEPLGDMKRSFNVLVWVAWLLSYSVLPLLRRPGTCGSRFFGGQAALGWVLILVAPALAFPREPMEAVVVYWLLVAFVLLLHRVKGHQFRKVGFETHSLSSGESVFSAWASPAQATTTWEPCAVFLAACLLLPVSIPLGSYLLVAGLGHSFATAVQEQEEMDRRRRLKDALWEAGMLGRYRD